MRSAAGRPPGRVHVAISMFSATVRSAKIPLSSGAQPTPSFAISYVRRPWMDWPRNSIPPARGRRYPMIVRRVVVFPAPFRPTRQTTSRGPTLSDTDRKMWLAWMNTSTASTVSMARPSPRPGAPADDRVDDAPVGLDRGRRAVGEHAPLVEGDDPVGVAEDDVHVVLDLDNRLDADPPGGRDERLHDRRLVRRAHAGRRLVEQDDLRPQRERRCHVEELLVPLRQVPGPHVTLRAQTEQLGDLERALSNRAVGGEGREEAGAVPETRDHRRLERLKSTLVNVLTGVLRPTAGTVTFRDRDVSGIGPARLARLGIARSFQLVQIFPDLTVLETLQAAVVSRLGRGTRLFASLAADREVQEGAIDVAELFGLGEKRHVPAKQLPQGDKKLLDVASAFALRPELILLDEPTSGVSTADKTTIMESLVSASKRIGVRAIIQVEHDMDIVFAD